MQLRAMHRLPSQDHAQPVMAIGYAMGVNAHWLAGDALCGTAGAGASFPAAAGVPTTPADSAIVALSGVAASG
jgi:hypothetical protein